MPFRQQTGYGSNYRSKADELNGRKSSGSCQTMGSGPVLPVGRDHRRHRVWISNESANRVGGDHWRKAIVDSGRKGKDEKSGESTAARTGTTSTDIHVAPSQVAKAKTPSSHDGKHKRDELPGRKRRRTTSLEFVSKYALKRKSGVNVRDLVDFH